VCSRSSFCVARSWHHHRLVARSLSLRRPIARLDRRHQRLDSRAGIERLGSRCCFGNPCGLACRTPRPHPPIFDIGATTNLRSLGCITTGAALLDVSSMCSTARALRRNLLRFRYQDGTFNGGSRRRDVSANSWQSYSGRSTRLGRMLSCCPTAGSTKPAAGLLGLLMTDVFPSGGSRLLLGDEASALAYIDNVALRSIPEPAARAARFRPSGTRHRTWPRSSAILYVRRVLRREELGRPEDAIAAATDNSTMLSLH